MISSLRGTILSIEAPSIVIEVGGVGYLVTVTEAHLHTLHVGDETRLDTVLVVRDDGFTLFGFADTAQRALFDTLTAVSGVGPKLALAVLGSLTAAQISRAVMDEDDKPFRSVTGIGPKMAKLIVVSLAGRVAPISVGEVETDAPMDPALTDEVVSALVGLGWNHDASAQAVSEVAVPGKSVPVMLRESLAILGGGARG